jgi:hypothetical protein
MKIHGVLPMVLFGLSLAYAQQDPLTVALNTDLNGECTTNFSLCVRVLKYKGEGKDDYALAQLISGAPSDAARQRYKIAQSRPKDQFWIQVATGPYYPVPPLPPLPPAIDCAVDLANVLNAHFAAIPEDLGNAAKDADTSSYLALYDLLRRVPAGGFPGAPLAVNTYRACFRDPANLVLHVKQTLGQTP